MHFHLANYFRELIDHHRSFTSLVWVSVGLIGQVLFAMRFIVQWITSESKKQSVIPKSFWYFSLFGSVILLAYAIHKKDLVFILGQLFGFVVYTRNLILIRQAEK